MNLIAERVLFDSRNSPIESAKPTFSGVEGFDLYNPSIPFFWKGKRYIFGRMERRSEWARSWVRLFEETAKDQWTLVPGSMIYQLEDPYIAVVDNEIVMGGTHVRLDRGSISSFSGYFYRGKDLHDLRYFTTGPEGMKDIRLVELANHQVGVFSRPKGPAILQRYGSESMVGFQVIDSLNELSSTVIADAPVIADMFGPGEWGGCNQAYLLDTGLIGLIGHKCYQADSPGEARDRVYLNVAQVFDPISRQLVHEQIIATRRSYPDGPAKKPYLRDCAFTSGIVRREDGNFDLYSGIGDTEVGRVAIPDPFLGYGTVVTPETLP